MRPGLRRAPLVAGLAAWIYCVAAPAAAQAPTLTLPADCTLGQTCFIQQYTDADPGPGAADYTCGGLSYDGHKGTDFGLPSRAAMRAGVAVLAAAPGTVSALRDGMPDTGWTDATADAVKGRDCGNGVVIDHGQGWQTQYCHMRRGSISVARGQAVTRGQRLGQVGLSGRTQFPHVHLSVRRDGAVVDPFAPDGPPACDGDVTRARNSSDTLWQTPPAYVPGGLLNAGLSTRVPDYAAIKDGTAATPLTREAPALVVWGYAFGGQRGDILRLVITGPDAQVIAHDAKLEKAQAQFFRAAGRKRPHGGWPPGAYRITVEMIRDGTALARITRTTTLH
ncbi:MAG: M23 family metallopeptidase [Sediminimonas qiaohouensis]|uniref:M23 family metallopeptidase n=1 Tax=Sediminimonas qiaohouensis TaxID=552061 RepID=A0A7C9HCJ9_9RHOB|nr:M23 family metallopeptidase [Sediminimonas qiaohouensis]